MAATHDIQNILASVESPKPSTSGTIESASANSYQQQINWAEKFYCSKKTFEKQITFKTSDKNQLFKRAEISI